MDLEIKGVGYASTLTNCLIYGFLLSYTYMIDEVSEAVSWPTREIF